jgi:hypothetical protein
MRKNNLVGIRIVASLKILFGTIFLIWIGGLTLLSLSASPQRLPLYIKVYGIIVSLFIAAYTINGFNLLALRNLARRVSVFLDFLAILMDSFIFVPRIIESFHYGDWHVGFYAYHLTILLIFISFIYYFSRPKVKEQFK